MNRGTNAWQAATAKQNQTLQQLGRTARFAAGGVGLLGGIAIVKSIGVAADFEQQISRLGAVSSASAKQMETLKRQALAAGAATKFSALDAAQAQTELAKGGLSVQQIMGGGLRAALGLAAAGELELADAATYTVNAIKLFGLEGRQAAGVADAFATAANKTTADVGDFGIALRQGGSAAKAAGLSFHETIAALEALAEGGIKGSDAGTSLKTSLAQMAKPTAKAAKLAEELGINFFDAEGNMKPLVEISGMLQDKLGGLTREQRLQAITTLVGTDGMRTLLSLYEAGPAKIARFEAGLRKQGTAADVAAKKQDNFRGKLENFQGSIETLQISVGSQLLPTLTRTAERLTVWANKVAKIAGRKDLDVGEKIRLSLEALDREFGPDLKRLDIPGKLAAAISFAVPRMAEAAARAAPKVVSAFAQAWRESNAWGKLVIGGFLLTKLGGTAAFFALGRRSGAAMGAGMAQGAATTMAGGSVAGGLGGAAAGGGLLAALRAKLLPALKRAGTIGFGIALADMALSEFGRRMAERSDEAFKALEAAASGPKLAGLDLGDTFRFLKVIPGVGGDDAAKGLLGSLKGIAEQSKAISPEKARQLREAIDGLGSASEKAKAQMRGIVATGEALGEFKAKFGIELDSGTPLRAIRKLETGFDRLRLHITGSLGDTLRQVRRNTSQIAASLGSNTRQGIAAARKNFRLGMADIRDLVRSGVVAADEGARAIRKVMVHYLGTFGIKGKTAKILAGSYNAKDINRMLSGDTRLPEQRGGGGARTHGGQRGGLVSDIASGARNYAGGGLVQFGRAGAAGPDDIPVQFGAQKVAVGSGEVGAVFNRHQLPILNARLSDMGGLPGFFNKFDRKHYAAKGGTVTGTVKHYAKGGLVGMIRAANKLDKAQFPYLWGGGHQATPAPFGPMDCSGAVSYVLQQGGVNIPTMVSGALASAGRPGPGAVTVFADPGHTLMRIGRRFFGTSGTNPGGGAGWFPDPGEGYLSRFTQRHFVGGEGAFGEAPKLPQLGLSGPGGSVHTMAQRAVDAVRGGAQLVLNKAASAVGAPIGSGDPGDPGPGNFTKSELMALWVKAGGPSGVANLAAAVALAESGGQSAASNTNSNGSTDRGLWQINSIHGGLSTFDPEENARAAVKISSSGTNWNPWVAYKSGAHRQYLARGGLVGMVGDSLGVGTAGPLKGRLHGKLRSDTKESRRSGTGLGILKRKFLGKDFDKYVFDLGTNDSSAGELAGSVRGADKATGRKPLVVPTVNGPEASAKNRRLRAMAGGDISLVEWAKRSSGLVGDDGVHATGAGYSKRAAMISGVLAQVRAPKDKDAPGRLPKLKGSLTHKSRQTAAQLAKTKDKARRAKILKRFAKVLRSKKYGLPTRLLNEIDYLGAAHTRFADLTDTAQLLNVDVENEDGTTTTTLGSVAGDNVAGWLTKDLSAMFSMRNKLIKAKGIVEKNKVKTDAAFRFVSERIKGLSKPGRTPSGWDGINPATGDVEKWNKQEQPKRVKRMREWRSKRGSLPGTRDFDRRGRVSEVPKAKVSAYRTVRNKLRGQRADLADSLSPEGENSIPARLGELQGQGPPQVLKSPWPIGTIFGGDILQAQLDIRDLFTVPPKVTDDTTGTDAGDDTRVPLLEQLLRESNLRLSVQERQFDVLRNFPPFGGVFHSGGVVPGPPGAERMVLAQAGERIIANDGGGGSSVPMLNLIFEGKARAFEDLIDARVEHVTRRQARSGGRVLPGRSGGT